MKRIQINNLFTMKMAGNKRLVFPGDDFRVANAEYAEKATAVRVVYCLLQNRPIRIVVFTNDRVSPDAVIDTATSYLLKTGYDIAAISRIDVYRIAENKTDQPYGINIES
jgi:hypothetical protein